MALEHFFSPRCAQYPSYCLKALLSRARCNTQGRRLTEHTHQRIIHRNFSRRRHHAIAAASGSQNSSGSQENERATESILGESDSRFFLKLLFISFAGAAVVKYGSLLLDTPFQPNLNLGLTIIAAPCLAFAIWMWSRSL